MIIDVPELLRFLEINGRIGAVDALNIRKETPKDSAGPGGITVSIYVVKSYNDCGF